MVCQYSMLLVTFRGIFIHTHHQIPCCFDVDAEKWWLQHRQHVRHLVSVRDGVGKGWNQGFQISWVSTTKQLKQFWGDKEKNMSPTFFLGDITHTHTLIYGKLSLTKMRVYTQQTSILGFPTVPTNDELFWGPWNGGSMECSASTASPKSC